MRATVHAEPTKEQLIAYAKARGVRKLLDLVGDVLNDLADGSAPTDTPEFEAYVVNDMLDELMMDLD